MRSHFVVCAAAVVAISSTLASPAAAQDGTPATYPQVVVPPVGGANVQHAPPQRRHHRAEDDDGEVRFPSHASADGFPLAGEHDGHFYLRDPEDHYRLYPGVLLQVDTRAYLGRGVDELVGDQGASTKPKMTLRRARVELGGELLKHWSFYLTGDFAGGPHLEHALVDVTLHKYLHVTVGQQQVPFTMENRTNEAAYAWMERPLAVRFAQPSNKDLGVMLAGESRHHLVGYEAGVFSGDGPNRSNADNRVDFAGRVHVRPLSGTGTIARNIQIGFSGTYGVRQHANVNYDMPGLQTDGGYTFWNPNHADAMGRTVRVLPSGAQSGFAGEVRIPVSRLDLRFEFMTVRRETREAIDRSETTNTERFGHLSGNAFYAQLGVWILGRPSMRSDPGEFHPPHARFPRGEPAKPQRGLEVVLHAEALRAKYSPGDRASVAGESLPDQTIAADVVGGGVNYYATSHALVALNYAYNIFPSSYSADNAALAPGNLPCGPANGAAPTSPTCHTGAHSLHEFAARVQIAFLSAASMSASLVKSEPPSPSDPPGQVTLSETPVAGDGSIVWRVGGVLKTMRPSQWLKNAFVLAPVFFAKDMFYPPLVLSAVAAFGVFCLLAGAVYTMNDLVDVEGDRVHPVKRRRPIPSGRVPLALAKWVAIGLVVVSLGGGALLDVRFALVALGYFVLNVAYSFRLKKVAYVDVGCIAAGFVLRVVAGGLATHVHVSMYLLVCTALLALFLGFGKRRHELAQAVGTVGSGKKQREALESYTPRALTIALSATAAATVATYLAYTLDPQTRAFFHSDRLWLTTLFTIAGMVRFLQLVTSRPKAESPTQEMLRDVPFVLILVLYVIVVITIVYALKPGVVP